MKYNTIREAAEAWVRGFNRIPATVLEKLLRNDPECVNEITPPALYDRVYVFDRGDYGEIISVSDDGAMYEICMDNNETVSCDYDMFEVISYDVLPMWGYLWSFDDAFDEDTIRDSAMLQKMANCGFRIYDTEDFGIIFGIDGAGCDFYESHWIPLYKLFGLQWHMNP